MLSDAYPARPVISKHRPVQRYPRSLLSIPLTLRRLMTGGIQASRGISLDISEGGLGAIMPGNLLVGETVEIDFCLRQRILSTVAIVRHTSNLRSGFEFLGLTGEERANITNAVQGHYRLCGPQPGTTHLGNNLDSGICDLSSAALLARKSARRRKLSL